MKKTSVPSKNGEDNSDTWDWNCLNHSGDKLYHFVLSFIQKVIPYCSNASAEVCLRVSLFSKQLRGTERL